MFIYTIIVTYNGRKWVDFCLGSLRRSEVSTIPIVVDNGSTDDTLTYIHTNYPEVILLPQEKNLGFGQANNVGIRYAMEHNADYCLLLNQDAAVAPNMVTLLLAQSDGKSLMSPIHMNGDGTKVDWSFRQSNLIRCDDLINDIFAHSQKESYLCGEICAACWLLPRAVIEKIGGFNPLFFHYSEDNNYYHRLVYHKIAVCLVPQARMYHDRKERGNKKVYNQQWLPNNLLLTLTNINFSWKQRLYNVLHTLWICYVYRLKDGLYQPGLYTITLCRLLSKLSTIRNSRKQEKLIAPNWL